MKKNRKKEKPAAAPRPDAFRFGRTASAALVLSWFAVCVYFYASGGDFFKLDVFTVPAWLKFPERYPALLKYLPRLLLLGLIALSALALGAAALKALRADADLDAPTWAVFSCAAGLGTFSYLILAAGVLGALSKPAILAIIAAPLPLFYFLRADMLARLREAAALLRGARVSLASKALLTILAFAAATAFFGALAPEIFYDALFYHLGMPNHYIQEGRIAAAPWNLSSSFPYLMHMLYVLALGISDGVLAKLLHYFTGLLLLGSMLSFGARFCTLSSALLAAAIFFTTPMVLMNWSVAGVEIASALYTFTAVYAMALFFESAPERRTGALLRAAVFTGLACSTKYPAFFTGVAGLAALFIFRRGHGPEPRPAAAFWREAAVYSGVTFLFVAPWLAKNLAFFGNPLYPFLGKLFGGLQPDPEKWLLFLSDGYSRNLPAVLESGSKFWQLLTHPWQLSMGGRGNADFIGITYLALLALPFAVKSDKARPLKYLLTFLLFMWVSWFTTTSMPRYFIPSLAILAMVLAEALRRADSAVLNLPLGAALGVLMIFGVQWTNLVLKSQEGWRPVFGFSDAASYLGVQHATYPTPYYQAMDFINNKLPASSRVLFVGEARSFYCARRHMAPSVHDVHPLVLWARESADGEELQERLKANGVTHLFLSLSEILRIHESYKLFQWDPRSIAVFKQWWGRHAKPLWHYDGRNSGGSLLFVYEVADAVTGGTTENFLAILHDTLEAKKAGAR